MRRGTTILDRPPVSSLSLAQLEDIARSQKATPAGETYQVQIVEGLLEMRRAGLLHRVHVHESRIRVELLDAPDIQRSVSWMWAGRIVREFRERAARKPAASVTPGGQSRGILRPRRSGTGF